MNNPVYVNFVGVAYRLLPSFLLGLHCIILQLYFIGEKTDKNIEHILMLQLG
jgi:hypothetical protein